MVTPQSIPGQMTVDEWAALSENASGELVDGALVEEEVPDFVHENYRRMADCNAEDMVKTKRRMGRGFEGLTLDLDRLWEELDELDTNP